MVSSKALELNQILDPKDILSMRELVKEIHIEENVRLYYKSCFATLNLTR